MESPVFVGEIDRRVLRNIHFRARSLACRRPVPGMEVDDVVQDLSLDLARRRLAFDPHRAGFRTFADRIVCNRLRTLVRGSTRARFERSLISLSAPATGVEGVVVELGDVFADPAAIDEDQMGLGADMRRYLAVLPDPLIECCGILLADSVVQGARTAGLARSTVYERRARLQDIAFSRGLGIYLGVHPDSLGRAPVSGMQQQDAAMSPRPPNVALLVTVSEVRAWLAHSEPGAALTYHRGVLAIDRLRPSSRLPELDRDELDRVASLLFQAAAGTRVCLVQRRYGRDDYEYVAVRRSSRGGSPI